MTPEFQKLEELAKLATSGEWDIEMSADSDSFLVTNHEAGFHIAIVPDELAAEYFVAANPTTILSLLSSLREKERELAALKSEGRGEDYTTIEEQGSTIENLRSQLSTLIERAAQIAENHEHAEDDFICRGENCGTIIAASIRQLKEGK